MKRLLLVLVLLFAFVGIVQAETSTATSTITVTVPNMARIDVYEGLSFASFTTPADAGDMSADVTNDTLIQYSTNVSTTAAAGDNREVTVQVTPLLFVDIKVQSNHTPTATSGDCGTSAITALSSALTTTATNIVTSIGNCSTGPGASQGFFVTYTLDMTGMKPHSDGNTITTVTYTLTENA